jgi:hypothetical protein
MRAANAERAKRLYSKPALFNRLLTFMARNGNRLVSRRCAPEHLGNVGHSAMTAEAKGVRVIPPVRARVARYREQAAYFGRLAEAEPVEKIRDQLKILARDYAYLAVTLESDYAPKPMN